MKKELTGLYRQNVKGFGFVTVEGYDEDFFISRDNRLNAFNMDMVSIVLLPERSGSRCEAKIVAVKERAVDSCIGVFERIGSSGLLYPDDQKLPPVIRISHKGFNGAIGGQKVVCKILSYGGKEKKSLPEGEVTEILGFKDDPGVDVMSVVYKYRVPVDFDTEVIKESEGLPKSVSKRDMKHRLDLTAARTITIDGDDTKDFDDAISIERKGDGYVLGVHIADVSHYVKENSCLDKDALNRGTSIYLADRVIPMLPERLSNDICSLKEKENRLTLSVLMRFDAKGRIMDYDIAESVICVDHRMTYSQVNEILSMNNRSLCVKYADILGDLFLMEDLAKKIRKRRTRRGAIDFTFPEAKIKLDDSGRAIDVVVLDRGVSEMMIEDFMLSANETVATEFSLRKLPFLYRNHDKPDEDKIISLRKTAAGFGIQLGGKGGKVTPKHLQRFIKKLKGLPQEDLLSILTLRSMARAEYSDSNLGHFGLASEYYCHFTSPIRRYPDLIVHRIIKESLHNKIKKKRKEHYASILHDIAERSSSSERQADELERDVTKMKMAEYMQDHVGEIFTGRISGVTQWGFYVQLPNTVEGMVPLRMITDDYYEFNEEAQTLTGVRTHRVFTLQDEVTIRVDRVDVAARMIDFCLYEEMSQKSHKQKRRKHGGKKAKINSKEQKSKS